MVDGRLEQHADVVGAAAVFVQEETQSNEFAFDWC